MSTEHLSDHSLERYCLGLITREGELAPLEEHLLCCPACVERAENIQDYVDLMRRAIILGDYDLAVERRTGLTSHLLGSFRGV